jgi:hypothetical protein
MQGVNCARTFASGFPHQTHPPTITLPVLPILKERQRGSFKAAPSENGNPQVRFYGSTVNVCSLTDIHIIFLMVLCLSAGSGKSVLWFVGSLLYFFKIINYHVIF